MIPIKIIKSFAGKDIRLTSERWGHILESHDYMAGYEDLVIQTISEPEYIVKGWVNEKIACKNFKNTHLGEKWMIVIYKEDSKDGFIISAFMTSNIKKILRRGILWPKQ